MSSNVGWMDRVVNNRRTLVLSALSLLIILTVGSGIYFKHYFVIFVFGMWLCAETLLMRLRELMQVSVKRGRSSFEKRELFRLYSEGSENALTLLDLKISEIYSEGSTPLAERAWLDRFRILVRVKRILEGEGNLKGKKALQRALLYSPSRLSSSLGTEHRGDYQISAEVNLQEITESAVLIADLLRRVQAIAELNAEGGGWAILTLEAQKLISSVLDFPYDIVKSRRYLEALVDSLQRDRGVPFLVLNLIRNGQLEMAREVGRTLLSMNLEDVEEDLRSTLYWVAEVVWFISDRNRLTLDHDATVRYLYHLCFTNPSRAGFLEIDSQFFSEFTLVNEIAEEGFLFKEALIESVLEVWRAYDGWFDSVFQTVLESMTGRKSKIYDERENWERYWRGEAENFSRDFLYVVEGNLCYASGELEDALVCYEKALKQNPSLRSALFNLAFVYAKLGRKDKHEWVIGRILSLKELMPVGLSVIGNSLLLVGQASKAKRYYDELKNVSGWEKKVDHYASTFCFEQGLFEDALSFARLAQAANPNDSTLSFHLSRCYSAVGEKEHALQMLKAANVGGTPATGQNLEQTPAWMDYYRFTLERDSGRGEEATETLMKIPRDYFQDAEELEAALAFAREKKDLVLLRHLRNKD